MSNFAQCNFQKDLEALINRYSIETHSNTPDFILAEYVKDCLEAFAKASNARTNWYEPRATVFPTTIFPAVGVVPSSPLESSYNLPEGSTYEPPKC